MRRATSVLVAVAMALGLATPARADAPARKQTPQERKRQQLLDELGLERVEVRPTTPGPAAVPSPDVQREVGAPKPAEGERPSPGPAAAPTPSFRRVIHPLLVQACQPCHRAAGPAAMTRLVLAGEPAIDYAAVRSLVTPATPPSSALVVKASGQTHAGGAPWPVGGEPHARVLSWISKGARLDGGSAPLAAAGTAPLVGTPPAPRRVTAAPTPPRLTAPTADPSPLEAAVSAVAVAPEAGVPADIGPILAAACAGCHGPRGTAAATRFQLSGDPAADRVAARSMVDAAAPARSPLVTKAQGELHGGGVVLAPGDPRLATLLDWAEATTKVTAPTNGQTAAAPAASAIPIPPAAAYPRGPPAGSSLSSLPSLPGGFMLNGRFDLAYERRTFSGNPFADGSTAALRSYHHFLFLSRESATDPFGLSVELLSLQFWEVHARVGGGARAWRLVLAGGKIVVPFGADPLTHQSYGGLVGFDQRILPVIWTQEGAAAHLTVGRGRLLLTDDLFVVRGYALPRADGVLNLQGDVSTADDAHIGWGNRLGVSWLNASVWYSAYFNALGFGRRLFMQALDVTLWRPRSIPVLGHFSAAAGLLRADVSGGGAGLDYYHLGSYFQVRYHPTDWLFLQYRQGLRTFDNRRGVILDETRLSPEDASTHNFAVVARFRGLSVALAYFLIFEKAGEIPNDFLRTSVTYDF